MCVCLNGVEHVLRAEYFIGRAVVHCALSELVSESGPWRGWGYTWESAPAAMINVGIIYPVCKYCIAPRKYALVSQCTTHAQTQIHLHIQAHTHTLSQIG